MDNAIGKKEESRIINTDEMLISNPVVHKLRLIHLTIRYFLKTGKFKPIKTNAKDRELIEILVKLSGTKNENNIER